MMECNTTNRASHAQQHRASGRIQEVAQLPYQVQALRVSNQKKSKSFLAFIVSYDDDKATSNKNEMMGCVWLLRENYRDRGAPCQ